MERLRITIAVIVSATLLVAVGTATMLSAAMSGQEEEVASQTLFPEATGEKGPASVTEKISLSDASEAKILDVKTGFALGTSFKPTPKPTPSTALSTGKSSPGGRSSKERFGSQSIDNYEKKSTEGPVFTWYDGDRTMRAVLQNDLVALDKQGDPGNDEVVISRGQLKVARKQSGDGRDFQPVFKPESGDGLMTLSGGVLLALDGNWDDAQVEEFFADNNIPQDRLSELDFIDNGFFVQTDPGFPALDLANELARQEGVVSASPNWSRERVPR